MKRFDIDNLEFALDDCIKNKKDIKKPNGIVTTYIVRNKTVLIDETTVFYGANHNSFGALKELFEAHRSIPVKYKN